MENWLFYHKRQYSYAVSMFSSVCANYNCWVNVGGKFEILNLKRKLVWEVSKSELKFEIDLQRNSKLDKEQINHLALPGNIHHKHHS